MSSSLPLSPPLALAIHHRPSCGWIGATTTLVGYLVTSLPTTWPSLPPYILPLTLLLGTSIPLAYLITRQSFPEQTIQQRTQELEEAYRALQAEQERVRTLYLVARELNISLDMEQVLNRALVHLARALQAPQASILLYEADRDRFVYRAALGRREPLPRGGKPSHLRPGEGLIGWVIENDQPVLIPELDEDPRWLTDPAKKGQSRSALAVPLSTGDSVLGAMLFFHPEPNHFTEEHLRLSLAGAQQITAAIKNTELHRLIRNQAERLGRTLREQQATLQRTQAILASIVDGVIVSDENGQIIELNYAAEKLLNRPRELLINQDIETICEPFDSDTRETFFQTLHNVYHEHLIRQADLSWGGKILRATFAPVFNPQNIFCGIVLTLRDITRELAVAQAKNEFVSTVAHELRTPMTSILGYTDLVLSQATGPLNESQLRFLNTVRSNIERMAHLVEDLLDISRIEAGRIRLQPIDFDLTSLIREIALSIQPTVEERQLTLHLHLPSDLPPVHADRDRVAQILNNLLSNAYRYTPAGGSITVQAQVVGSNVQVDVIDTGIGIRPEDQKHLFKPFFRADHPQVRQAGGTGLGLSIVKSLIELQGGTIWVESEVDKGSTFHFTLPIAQTASNPSVEGEPWQES